MASYAIHIATAKEFLKCYSIKDSFYAGWFFHLIVDTEFYQNYLDDWGNRADAKTEKLYADYNFINGEILEKYDITLPKEIEEYNMVVDGELTYIDKNTIHEFIKEMGNVDLETYEYVKK